MKYNKTEKNDPKSKYSNVLEMNSCTKNFWNSAIYFIRPECCVHCCFRNKSRIFWLKFTIVNFRRFPRTMEGNVFLMIPHGIGNIWIKFQLSGKFSLVFIAFGLIQSV